jgi:hypothetical protein
VAGPLVFQQGVAATAFKVILGAWVAFEVIMTFSGVVRRSPNR